MAGNEIVARFREWIASHGGEWHSTPELIAEAEARIRMDPDRSWWMTAGQPSDQTEALAQALVLAIVAPDDEKAQQAVALAEQLSAGLPELEVARAKKLAQGMAKEWEDEQ